MHLYDLILHVVSIIIPLFLHVDPVRQHDSILSGDLYYNELIKTPNDARFQMWHEWTNRLSLSYYLF